VVPFPRRELAGFGWKWSATAGVARMLWRLAEGRYDLIVDLHGRLRSAIFTWAAAAGSGGSAARVGYASASESAWLAYGRYIPVPPEHSAELRGRGEAEVHAVDRYLWLTPLLGLPDGPPDFTLHLPAEAVAAVDGLVAENGLADRPMAVLVPGTVWPTKHWAEDRFAETGRRLRDRGYGVAVAGAPGERDRCRRVAEGCPGSVDLCGRTTPAGLAALLRRAAVCVTNDSGSMHLAVALNRPVVSIFGPTNPVRTGPYGRPESVVRADLPCSPCYLRRLEQCPHDHGCMKSVSVDAVMERLEAVTARETPSATAAAG
jgi:ADP-heptose:LPS heptosyltransferase